MFYPDYSVEEYRKLLEFYVEVINHALDGLPEDQVRFHAAGAAATARTSTTSS